LFLSVFLLSWTHYIKEEWHLVICGAEGLDEVDFVHGVPFFGKCLFLGREKISINLQQCDRICQTHVYGPEQSYFDKNWIPGDAEMVK